MYNPYEDQLGVNEFSEDELAKIKAHAESAEAQVEINKATAETKPGQPSPTTTTPQGTQQPTQETQKDTQFPEDEEPYDIGDYARTMAEGAFAAPTGTVDWAIDVVNHVPGVNIPKLPKFQNRLTQAGRELSSILVPTIVLTRGLGGLGKLANARVGWKAGQNELVKFLGETGVAAGAGAFVDATNKLNETDDNLQGTLKKTFPGPLTDWISNDWATLDSDSPELKKSKNTNEGVGLGIFSDFLVGVAKLLRARSGVKKIVEIIPESEQAKTFIKNLPAEADTPEAVVLQSMDGREAAKDALGEYRLSKQADPEAPVFDSPVFGIHNGFDVNEEGIRSVDRMGVVGASIDLVRINQNLGTTWGRLGSIISEAALKMGIKADSLKRREVVKAITDQIKNVGKYSARYGGAKIPFDVIDKAGQELAEVILDPRMDTGTISALLDNYMDSIRGTKTLDDVGYNAAFKAIKGYLDEFMNMDTLKAQAYLQTSIAGQVSDMAEGARLMDGTAAIERAQEQILDRLEFLMVEKGLSSYLKGSALNYLKLWDRIRYINKDPKTLEELARAARDEAGDTIDQLSVKAQNTVNTLRSISKERPEFLKPFALAYEFTDGNVDSMHKLNNYIDQSTGTIRKAFVDDQPEIPSVIVQGMWSNIYNSVLTSISTPMKAGLGNAALLLERPFAVLAGSLGDAVKGDLSTLKRGWYQYSAVMDSMRKGVQHMNLVFRKASMDPSSVNYIMRDDIVRKNEQQMQILKSFAEAAEQRGDFGPMVMYQQAETMQALADNPMLRFGANAMSALDGFARAVIANAEARGRVYDKFIDGSRKLDAKGMRKALDDQYNEMFDATGMINDSAVEYASREIAMNLDNPAVDAMSAFIARYPMVKPFMMFPRTSANIIGMANKHAPISIFAKEVNDLAFKSFEDFTPQQMRGILETRGIKVTDQTLVPEFRRLQAEIRGRKAIGTFSMTLAAGLFLNGGLRGNGHYDKERQRVRQEMNWKPRTYQGWDGKWYSYEGMGPISDLIALTADVMDNFDTIEEQDLSVWINKLGYLISANLTNKSMLAGIEPMNDVLSGNPAALSRWGASFASSFAPLSGARNELGRLLAPQLRELDMDFIQLLRNRNKFTDVLDPNSALPDAHDWVDGKKIGYSENIFVRMWNATMPMKVYEDVSPERQFLIDIEYDSRPSFMRNGQGIDYTPEERSELYNLIGKHGYFKRRLKEIMQSTEAKAWRQSIAEQRRGGARINPEKWMNLYNQIDVALDIAKRNAEAHLSPELRSDVLRRTYEKRVDERLQQKGLTIHNMYK